MDDRAAIVFAPIFARDHPHDFEFVAIWILAVEGLGGAVIALARERAKVRERGARVRQVFDTRYLLGEMVEANSAPWRIGCIGTDGHQAEVVMVRRARCTQEGHLATFARYLLEPKGLLVERHRTIEITDVEDGVIQA